MNIEFAKKQRLWKINKKSMLSVIANHLRIVSEFSVNGKNPISKQAKRMKTDIEKTKWLQIFRINCWYNLKLDGK